MAKYLQFFTLFFLVFFAPFSEASAANSSPAKIVSGIFSNAVSVLMKYLWSLKTTTKTAVSSRPLMKFESGYSVETVFDGSKLGIEPHSVEILPTGDLLILDSINSNLYKISSSLSLNSRPKLIAGSAEGDSGHVDGKLREAKLNHPTGLTADDRGNIYVADTGNMAIRKISDAGISTIAGGKNGRGGHVDGPSEDAKFSNDFDLIYIGSSCSLLVIDRGNQAIREIQLNYDDCAYQYASGFPLGIAVLAAAGFFGYMMALLQRRVSSIISSQNNLESIRSTSFPQPPYQKQDKLSVWPPLIPTEDDQEKQEETFFASLAKLLVNTGAVATEILGSVFPSLKKKPQVTHNNYQTYSNPWPVQDSFVIADGDEPPPPAAEARTPTPRKTYAFMTKDAEKMQQFRQSRNLYNGWDNELSEQQMQRQQNNNSLWEEEYALLQQKKMQRQQKHHRHHSSVAETRYEQTNEKTNEIVFGAVQEKTEPVVIKPLDYSGNAYDRRKIKSRNI